MDGVSLRVLKGFGTGFKTAEVERNRRKGQMREGPIGFPKAWVLVRRKRSRGARRGEGCPGDSPS